MSKGIFVGTTPSLPATFDVDVSGFASDFYCLDVNGTSLLSATLSIFGGDGANFELILITDDSNAAVHQDLIVSGNSTNMKTFPFYALCSHLRFDLVGGTPEISLTLFPRPRY